jgi:cysteine desulfurase
MPAVSPVFLDNQSTTRVDPRVVEAMLPYFDTVYGNPGSASHVFGWEARDAVDAARTKIAQAIGAHEREIVFTSGATESNNLALRGVVERPREKRKHLVSVTTEHRAVLDPLARLGRRGYEVTLVEPRQAGHPQAGIVEVDRIVDALRDDTVLVSVMLANNEIGAIAPLAELGPICKSRGILLHTDATQGVGKIPVDVEKLQVDLMSFTAHKIYGPKGIGALYVRRRNPQVRLVSQIDGGGQERDRRSGTLNVPGIVGFAKALELCRDDMHESSVQYRGMRDRLADELFKRLPELQLNGPVLDVPMWRLDVNLNIAFTDVDGEALMLSMREVAVSSGSACTSASPAPSHVLRGIGLADELARSSLRFAVGRFNTDEEIHFAVTAVCDAVERLRSLRGK